MTKGLYTAYTGMLAQQMRMDVISNNLANINTAGFKKDNVVFESYFQTSISRIKDPEMAGAARLGKANFGVQMGKYYTDYEQGALQQTNDPYTVALQGKGMIAVGKYDAEGNVVTNYTRDGSFTINQNGELITKDGYFAMGENGPITITAKDFSISEAGNIVENGITTNQLTVVDFEDMTLLKKTAGDYYEVPEGTETKAYEGVVVQGFVEGSNVNSVTEMVQMINVMRTYETNQKIMSTIDETMGRAVNDIAR